MRLKNLFLITLSVALLLSGYLWWRTDASRPSGRTDRARVNTVGKVMSEDAAPLDRQVFSILLDEPLTLDIGIAVYEAGGAVFSFEGLTRLDHNNELTPAAADRWEVSPDGRRWTFYLRGDAKWSDGRPVTARDFEYAYLRMIDPAVGNRGAASYYDIKGARAFNRGAIKDPGAVGIKAIDDYTFVIETERPCPYLPLIASFPTTGPVPRWQVEKYGPRWTEAGNLVSNSTFRLDIWEHGSRIEFVLDPNYNGPHKAFVERIIGKFTDTAMLAGGTVAYENNEVDFQNLTSVDLPRIRSHAQLSRELDISQDFITHYLFFNTRQAPFDNLKARQAIAHAIDRKAICEVALQGMGAPAHSLLPPGFPGYNDTLFTELQRFDPEQARRLLAEAGYSNGKGFPRYDLWINNIQRQNAALAIQQMLREHLNIDVGIRVVENVTYRKAQFQWQIPLSLIQYHYDYPDPNNMLMVWRSQEVGISRHPWTNADFDRTVDAAAAEMNPETRSRLYDEAQRILSEDAGAVFLYYGKMASLRKPWLKGIKRDKNGEYPFWSNNTGYMDVYIAEH